MSEYKYKLAKTNKFKKDYKLMQKRNNFDKEEFQKVLDILLRGDALPSKYCNHILEPKSERLYECHIKPDWLLIYMINNDMLILTLTRTGSHSDLF